jgi:DNA topoisomerase-2
MAVQKQDTIEINKRRISSFLNTEVRDFAKYVIETRACPSIMDGLKLGARKIVWAALNGDLKNQAKVKMPSLIGDVFKLHYNHGDASLVNTVVQLCSTHTYKYAPLEVVGQIGTLRVPKCDTAPRYLHVKKSPYLDFFKTDTELLERLTDDGDLVEPKYFLPIIPIVLLWRTNSPGFGFSFRSFSYGLDSVIDNCLKSITQGSCSNDIDEIPLIPFVVGIKPENMIYNGNKDSWYCVGEYTLNLQSDSLIINDLPYDVSFEAFDEHLHNLIEKQYINSFTDLSMDGKICYVVNFPKGRLQILSSDKWKFFTTMKMFSKVIKNTLNCIDSDSKTILNFSTPYELIDVFVKKRLVFYQKRKTRTMEVVSQDIIDISNKIRFVSLIINDELIINKRKIVDIKIDLDKHKLPYDVLKMNIDKLTIEEIDKMEDKRDELTTYLEYIRITPITEMYVQDLVSFKAKYSKINI